MITCIFVVMDGFKHIVVVHISQHMHQLYPESSRVHMSMLCANRQILISHTV